MNEPWLVVVLSTVVSLSTLAFTQFGLRRKAETDYVERIERRLRECEQDRDRLWRVVRELQSRSKRNTKRIREQRLQQGNEE